MYEVEVKLPVADLEAVANRLSAAGANPLGASKEADVYFAHPGRDFAATDEALRLRRSDAGTELTYKGPRQDAAAKVRREINIDVTGDVSALLAAIDFHPAATVKKQRRTWKLDGCTVSLDDVAGAGTFVEVEAWGPDVPAATALVQRVVERLDLQDVAPEPRSYLELANA